MRVAYYIIGAVGSVLALWLFVETMDLNEGFWAGCLGSGVGAVGAVTVVIAGIKKYRGHWPFVIGLVLFVFAFGGLGSEIDDHLAHRTEDLASGVILVTLFSTCGVLLLFSGHKLHRCLVELENLRRSDTPVIPPLDSK